MWHRCPVRRARWYKSAQPYPKRRYREPEGEIEGPRGELATETFFDCDLRQSSSKVKTVFLNYLELLIECIKDSSVALPSKDDLYALLAVLGEELGDSRVQPLILKLSSSDEYVV